MKRQIIRMSLKLCRFSECTLLDTFVPPAGAQKAQKGCYISIYMYMYMSGSFTETLLKTCNRMIVLF